MTKKIFCSNCEAEVKAGYLFCDDKCKTAYENRYGELLSDDDCELTNIANEKKFKAHLRIPTKEQYAYIEVLTEGTAEEIIMDYIDFTNLYQEKSVETKPF